MSADRVTAPRRPAHPPLLAEHVLAWSVTRHKLLAECARAVFWTAVGARGHGLAAAEAPSARLATCLKQLTSLPLLTGTVVHHAAREVVQAVVAAKALPAVEDLLDAARFVLNQAVVNSRPHRINRFWETPWLFTVLQEMATGRPLEGFAIARTQGRLQTCMQALVTAPVLADLQAAGPAGVWFPPPGPLRFEPAPGQLAWGALDLAYQHVDMAAVRAALMSAADRPQDAATLGDQHDEDTEGDEDPEDDGERAYPTQRGADIGAAAVQRLRESTWTTPVWCVVDWKTGTSGSADAEALQLGAYGLWLEQAGYPTTHGVYLGRIVDLVRREDRWVVIDAALLARVRAVIDADLARLRGLLLTEGPAGVVPRPKQAWALATDQRGCPRCRFHRLCAAELMPAPTAGRLSRTRTAVDGGADLTAGQDRPGQTDAGRVATVPAASPPRTGGPRPSR